MWENCVPGLSALLPNTAPPRPTSDNSSGIPHWRDGGKTEQGWKHSGCSPDEISASASGFSHGQTISKGHDFSRADQAPSSNHKGTSVPEPSANPKVHLRGIGSSPEVQNAVAWLKDECGLDDAGAEQLVEYIVTGRAVLGEAPTRQTIIAERFFDEGGGMQLIVHAPFGARD